MSVTPQPAALDRITELHARVVESQEHNKGALVHRDLAIREAVKAGRVSQAEIARATGLTRTRVAQIVGITE